MDSVAPSTAPLAAPVAAPTRTLPTALPTLVIIPGADLVFDFLAETLALFEPAVFLELTFFELTFFAAVLDDFFFVLFLVAICALINVSLR